jgi:predicted PurR-regulated permease PerM
MYALAQLLMILLCAFYFFRDGEAIVAWLQTSLPIDPERQRLVTARLDEVVKGAMYGNTLIALVEGLIGGVGFWLAGLPSAVLWGTIMAVLAYLPLVGAGLIWMPVALYLLIQGAYAKAGILAVTGVVIFALDYLVRTIVVGGRSRLHTLLVFFSVLGRDSVFWAGRHHSRALAHRAQHHLGGKLSHREGARRVPDIERPGRGRLGRRKEVA